MATIKAMVEVEIFNDPEYCETMARRNCQFIGERKYEPGMWCFLFKHILKIDITLNYAKCDACKTAWAKAKS